MRRGRALLLSAALLALATAGCSFLLGVSEDPVVDAADPADPADAADGADGDAAPE